MMKNITDNGYHIFFRGVNSNREGYNKHIEEKYDPVYKFSSFITNYHIFYTYIDYLSIQASNINYHIPNTQTVYGSHHIEIEINRLHDAIRNRKVVRSKIVGKVYNYRTRMLEYELEDGNYIPLTHPYDTKETMDINILPNDFLREYDKVKFRDEVIENILNNE